MVFIKRQYLPIQALSEVIKHDSGYCVIHQGMGKSQLIGLPFKKARSITLLLAELAACSGIWQ